jgi:hypothetical protein
MSKSKRGKVVSPSEVLSKGWHDFNRDLAKLTEEQLRKMLELELAGKNRSSYIERIHTRFNNARIAREKQELAEKVTT